MQAIVGETTKNSSHEYPSKLRIQLLSSFELTGRNGAVLELGSRKARALLAYLAMTHQPTTRETLAFLLWPEMTERRAKSNLRTTLSMLKRHLAPYLTITAATVAFNRHQPYFLDVELFQQYVNAAVSTQRLEEFQAAVDLYKGEFLQGFQLRNAEPFVEWLLQQREHLHFQLFSGFETLIALCVERGEYHLGLAAGRKLLTVEPWSETTHRQLMILLAKSGQRMSALAQYDRCRQILAQELGVEPMAETTALYEQIQAGTFERTSVGSTAPLAPPATTAAAAVPPPNKAGIPNNLITPLTRFVGRQEELAFLLARLTAADARLLTITGPGGVGKTSLALALARRLRDSADTPFPDGIFFASLVAIEGQGEEDSDRNSLTRAILTKIAESIGCQLQDGGSVQVQLQTYLQPRRLLLILDNVEHVVDSTETIVNLLASAPELTVLITSRVRLNIRGETSLALQGLSLPTHATVAAPRHAAIEQESEAVALFVERAQRIDANFVLDTETLDPVVQICQLVGGLPLAIEMIAAWLSVYSCTEIAEKLKRGESDAEWLSSPFRDQPERHQTLQRVFADSWALIPPAAQRVLAQLSIFTGSFTRNAARAITDAPLSTLVRLHNHSLLQINGDGVYALHPLSRQFAAQKWQALTAQQPQERHRLRQAHSRYYLQRVAELTETRRGEAELAAINSYRHSHAEIVRGWQWAVRADAPLEIQRSMAGLFRYLELTNQSREGERLFGTAAAHQRAPIAQWLQVAQSHFLRRLAEHDQARIQIEALLATLSPVLDDPTDDPTDDRTDDRNEDETEVSDRAPRALVIVTHTFALCELGWVHYEQGDYAAAQRCFSTAHAQAKTMPDSPNRTQMLNGLGAVAFSTKRYADAREHYQAALAHAQQHEDLHGTAIVLGNLAALAQATQAHADAEQYLQMRLRIDERTQNERQLAVSYQRLGQLALLREAYAEAELYFRRSLAQFEQLGYSPEIAHVLLDLSKSLLRQNQVQLAAAQCMRSLQVATHAKMTPRILAAVTLLAEIRMVEGKKEQAGYLLQIVLRHAPVPVATQKVAERLHATLLAELDEEVVSRITQESEKQSLHDLSVQFLVQEPLEADERSR